MNKNSMIVELTVHYKEMSTSLRIDLSAYQNEYHYLDIIKDHVNIAKLVIDRETDRLRNLNKNQELIAQGMENIDNGKNVILIQRGKPK